MASEGPLYIGFDLSTQQLKGLVVSSDLKVEYEAKFDFDAHSHGFEIQKGVMTNEAEHEVFAPVALWLQALDWVLDALQKQGLDFRRVKGISGAGQQHGPKPRTGASRSDSYSHSARVLRGRFLVGAMEFWGKEVKPGATVSCKVDDGLVIHLSQAALGEPKKASENVIVSVKIDDKKIVLGTLSVEKHPQISCDLIFDKDFEISHNSKTASVFFCGYKSPVPLFEPDSGGDSSDEELETDQIPTNEISAAKVPVKGGMKVESSSSDDDDDFTDSESDSEMSDEDDSSDEDEVSSGADPSDDSGSEEQTPTPKKTDVVVGKKRAIEVEAPSGKKAKSEQSAQKTGDKVSTHSAKQSSKTPADKSTKTPTADKKSPKSGSHACKSCNKSFGSASALESHQKAKKHEA